MQMKCAISQYYLEKILAERAVAYTAAARLSLDELWCPAEAGGWSVGQNFDHLIRCVRFSRWLLIPTLPALRLNGYFLRNRAYEKYIDNPYHKEDRNVPPPPGTCPKDYRQAPRSFTKLKHDLEKETDKLISLTGAIPPEIMGHIVFPDPEIGSVNLVQCFQVFFFHEHHHLRFVHRLLARMRSKQAKE